MKTLVFCTMILLFVIACRKNAVSSANQNGSDTFPDKIGDSWTYLVNDTTYTLQTPLVITQYTMTVSVIDSITLPGGIKAHVWVYNYQNVSDTNFVFHNGDTVFFASNKRYDMEIVRKYVIPIRLNNSWQYSVGSVHNVRVDSQANIVVVSQEYENAFHLYGYPGRPDEIITIDEWYANNVGIVKRYVDASGTLNPNKYLTLWTLVSYHLL
jgi:hypothetical protein